MAQALDLTLSLTDLKPEVIKALDAFIAAGEAAEVFAALLPAGTGPALVEAVKVLTAIETLVEKT